MAVSSPLIDIVLPLSTNKYNVNVYHTRKVFDTDVNGRLASQIVVNIFLNQTVDIRNKINSSSTLSRPSQSSNISFLSQVINTFCRVWTTQGSAHRWFYPYICLHHITFKIANISLSRYSLVKRDFVVEQDWRLFSLVEICSFVFLGPHTPYKYHIDPSLEHWKQNQNQSWIILVHVSQTEVSTRYTLVLYMSDYLNYGLW